MAYSRLLLVYQEFADFKFVHKLFLVVSFKAVVISSKMKSSIDLIPRLTIHPDKICLYKEVKWVPNKVSSKFKFDEKEDAIEVNELFLKSTRKNNGFLSSHAKRKLFRSLDYMFCTSDKKRVFSKVQNKYVSFRIVFVTLTLPSKQIHSDKEITNTCLNQLFVELSKYHNVKKFVWRAEKQENGNIHYHILINEFVEWSELRRRWNRIVNKLGYVDRYQERMERFYAKGFRPTNNDRDKRTIDQQRKAFILGQKSGWRSPNSTDIHDTRKVKDIKAYVGKYMAKDPEVNLEAENIEQDTKVVDGRLWACSRNLSNVEGCQLVEDWEISDELEKVVSNSGCRVYRDVYFSVVFIDFKDLEKFGSRILYLHFVRYLYQKFNYSVNLKIAS